MSGMGHNLPAADRLKAIVERVERVDEEIKNWNDDKKEIYAEAKSAGFDVKILKTVIRRRAMKAEDRQEQDSLLELYERALSGALEETGTSVATRARARDTDHDPETGEVHETPTAETPGLVADPATSAAAVFLHQAETGEGSDTPPRTIDTRTADEILSEMPLDPLGVQNRKSA